MADYEFGTWLDVIKTRNNFGLTLRTNVENSRYQVPSVLEKIENYLFNEKLEDKSVKSLIKLVKEEWLNKVKVFYKFIKSPLTSNLTDLEGILEMLNLDKKDELALKYWQAGLSNECKTQIRTF